MARALDGIRFYAAAARNIYGDLVHVSPKHHTYILRQPLGVVAAIVPWNVPIVLTVSKLHLLCCGNSVVVKPSQTTPLTALYPAQLWQSEFPAGCRTCSTALDLPSVKIVSAPSSHRNHIHRRNRDGTATWRVVAHKIKDSCSNWAVNHLTSFWLMLTCPRQFPAQQTPFFTAGTNLCRWVSTNRRSRDLRRGSDWRRLAAESIRIGDPFDENTQFGCVTSIAHRDDLIGWVDTRRKMVQRQGRRIRCCCSCASRRRVHAAHSSRRC